MSVSVGGLRDQSCFNEALYGGCGQLVVLGIFSSPEAESKGSRLMVEAFEAGNSGFVILGDDSGVLRRCTAWLARPQVSNIREHEGRISPSHSYSATLREVQATGHLARQRALLSASRPPGRCS